MTGFGITKFYKWLPSLNQLHMKLKETKGLLSNTNSVCASSIKKICLAKHWWVGDRCRSPFRNHQETYIIYEGKRGRKLVSPPKMYSLLFLYHNRLRLEISNRKKKFNFIKVNGLGGGEVNSSTDGSQIYICSYNVITENFKCIYIYF